MAGCLGTRFAYFARNGRARAARLAAAVLLACMLAFAAAPSLAWADDVSDGAAAAAATEAAGAEAEQATEAIDDDATPLAGPDAVALAKQSSGASLAFSPALHGGFLVLVACALAYGASVMQRRQASIERLEDNIR